jgi:hypothetical protein
LERPMRTQFISEAKLLDRVREATRGNRLTRMAVVAYSWKRGREILATVARELPPRQAQDTSLDYDRVNIKTIPVNGCLVADFLTRDEYDEVFVVPDLMTNLDVHSLSQAFLGMK